MKKIALVSLGVGAGGFSQFSKRLLNATVALYYIGKLFENAGFEVIIIDQPNNGLSDFEIMNQLLKEKPNAVLFAQFHSTRERIISLVRMLRTNGLSSLFGVGGHDATFSCEPSGVFNIIFKGPALSIVVERIKAKLQHGSWNGTSYEHTLGKTENPNLLPILDHNNYSGTEFLVGSLGCYAKDKGCQFCTTPQFCPSGWRKRKLDSIFAEVENMVKKGKKDYCFLTDDDSLVDVARGNSIITGCRERGLNAMMIMTKPKQIVRADKKGYLQNWQNVKRVFLGLENGSVQGLSELGKQVGSDANKYLNECKEAFQILKKHGMSPFTGHINFTGPRTSFSQLKESTKFLFELGECDWTALTQSWRPYPGTKSGENFLGNRDNEFRKINNEFYLDYHDNLVGIFYEIVMSLRSQTDTIDNLLYSVTDEIFIQNPNQEIWRRYWRVKQLWNDWCYHSFIEIMMAVEEKRFVNTLNINTDFSAIVNEFKELEFQLQ